MKKYISTIFVALLVVISIFNVINLYLESSKVYFMGPYNYKYNYNLGFEKIKIFIPFILIEIICLVKIIIDEIKGEHSRIVYVILFFLTLITIIISGFLLSRERKENKFDSDKITSLEISAFNSEFNEDKLIEVSKKQ